MEYMSELSRTMALTYTATPVSPFKTLAALEVRVVLATPVCCVHARDTGVCLDDSIYNHTIPRR